jgi:hypothetical protein
MDGFIDAIEMVAAVFVGIVAADIFISVLLRYFFSLSIPDGYDFGRPFRRGTDLIAGSSGMFTYGRLFLYVNGEYQQAPAQALAQGDGPDRRRPLARPERLAAAGLAAWFLARGAPVRFYSASANSTIAAAVSSGLSSGT